jgi:RNA polymerase sigma-70 factor (ECF subfamily)
MGVEIREKRVGALIRAAKSVVPPSTYREMAVCNEVKQSGSRQHIIELYDDLRPSLHIFLSARGLGKEHSEDVIQEAFLRLVRHIVKRGPDENPRAWVFRVAHNLSMDHHRSERRRFRENERQARPMLRERVDPAPDPEQKIMLSERIRRFREAFAELTPKQQHCLLLRAKGLRYREIALHMGVSVQRVGELMQRAISLIEAGVVRR